MIYIDKTEPRAIIIYENPSEAEKIITTITEILGTTPFTANLLVVAAKYSDLFMYTNATFKHSLPTRDEDHISLDLLTPDSKTCSGVNLSIWPSITDHPTPTLDITPKKLTVRIAA